MIKTLYIGLGGMGGRVIQQIKKLDSASNINDNAYAILDRDLFDQQLICQPEIPYIPVGSHSTVKDCIALYQQGNNIEDWFPMRPYILYSVISNLGLRCASRLAFWDAMQDIRMNTLRILIEKLLEDGHSQQLRVVVVTSLAGNTGSGIFIQTALWIRKVLSKMRVNCGIYGFFAGAEVFMDALSVIRESPRQCEWLRANTYAALKELAWLTDMKMGRTPAPAEPVCLDGLFDSSIDCRITAQDPTPIYDRMHFYDVDDQALTMDLNAHILHMAKIAFARTETSEKCPMPASEKYLYAYHHLHQNMPPFESRIHLDKRWYTLLAEQ